MFTFHRFNFKDSAFFFYCACSVHLRMVLETDFLRMDVPTKTGIFAQFIAMRERKTLTSVIKTPKQNWGLPHIFQR